MGILYKIYCEILGKSPKRQSDRNNQKASPFGREQAGFFLRPAGDCQMAGIV